METKLNGYLNTVSLQNKPQEQKQVVRADISEPKKIDKKKLAVGIAAAAAVTAIGVGAILLQSKSLNKTIPYTEEQEKLFQKLLDDGLIDEKHLNYFKDIFSKRRFNPKEAYEKMVKMIDFGDTAPEFKVDPKLYGGALYSHNKGTITVSNYGMLGAMRHELVHADQCRLMYRAFGKESMIEAYVESSEKVYRRNNAFVEDFGKKFNELSQEEINKFTNKLRSEYANGFNDLYYQNATKNMPALTDEEIQRAKLYLDNAKNYDGSHGILEKEAYNTEIDFERMLSKFLDIVKR